MSKFSKKAVGVAGLSAAVLVGGMGGILAYLTDAETATNTFTIGNVAIESLEPSYLGNDDDSEEGPKDIIPNQEVAKDPQIDNKGISDAVVFMVLDSPMEEITVINDDGTLATAKGVSELFWYKDEADGASTHANNFDSNWVLLNAKSMYVKIAADGTETKVEEADLATTYAGLASDDKLVYRRVFGYNAEIQGTSVNDGDAQTAANKITTPLFDKVQLKNVLENEIDGSTNDIVIRSYAIQSTKILENDIDITGFEEEALAKVYDIFVRQNSTGDDASGLKVEGLREVDDVSATSNGSSETEDQHVNRWDTTDNVSGAGDNVQP